MKKSIWIGFFAFVFISSSASALELKLVNKTGKELHELYFAPAGDEEWGPDQLGDEVVEDGETYTLTKIPKGKYDVLFVDENDDKCDLRDVDFTSSETFVMSKSVIKGCQAATAAEEEEDEEEEDSE